MGTTTFTAHVTLNGQPTYDTTFSTRDEANADNAVRVRRLMREGFRIVRTGEVTVLTNAKGHEVRLTVSQVLAFNREPVRIDGDGNVVLVAA